MVIIIGNGHSDPKSNLRLGCLHFTYPWEMNPNIFPQAIAEIVEQTELFNLGMATKLEEGKL